MHDLRPLPGVLPGGTVGAQQRGVLLEGSVERFRGGPPDDGLCHGGVALHHGVDHSRGVPPDHRIGQHGQLQEGQRLAVGELARRLGGRRGDRVMTQLLQHCLDPLLHRAVAGQRAAGRAYPFAQRQELMEGLVRGGENARQEGGEVGGVADRVLHAVKGHGPHPVREQVRVGLSEEAAC